MSLKSAPSFPGMKERFLVSYRIQFPFFQAGFTRLKSAPSFPGMKKRVLISYKILVLLGIQERVSWSERVCYSMAWMFDIPRIITYKTDSKLWSVMLLFFYPRCISVYQSIVESISRCWARVSFLLKCPYSLSIYHTQSCPESGPIATSSALS